MKPKPEKPILPPEPVKTPEQELKEHQDRQMAWCVEHGQLPVELHPALE